ncbi:MAG: bifunctional folylpolyglutamate synthase/dihydrofolate synthase [Bacteroidetes bacterium]|nr:bifunctional folylpolyglutamate synthase/dihydrofolate synthase [Bacteroidota bacterium]
MVNRDHLIGFLRDRIWFGIKPGLEGMHSILSELGYPERAYPVIHVAGTNGKGSTCSYLSAGLQSAGLKVGLYTSPHIRYLNERIRLNASMIPDEEFLEGLAHVEPLALRLNLTFFETVTAVAFWWFAQKQVDVVVLETGMGGRLDATNVVDPDCSVITSIGLDHQQYLGTTIAAIAREKAGIIKTGKPVFCGPVPREALDVITEVAREKEAHLQVMEESDDPFLLKNRRLAEHILHGWFAGRQIPLPVGFRDHLDRFTTLTGLEGRFHTIPVNHKTWIFDAAHNPDGIKALQKAWNHEFPHTEPVFLFGCVGDKSVSDMLEGLKGWVTSLDLLVPEPARGMTAERLSEEATTHGFSFRSHQNAMGAIHALADRQDRRPVLVAGSLYLLGNVFSALETAGWVKKSPSGLTIYQ